MPPPLLHISTMTHSVQQYSARAMWKKASLRPQMPMYPPQGLSLGQRSDTSDHFPNGSLRILHAAHLDPPPTTPTTTTTHTHSPPVPLASAGP